MTDLLKNSWEVELHEQYFHQVWRSYDQLNKCMVVRYGAVYAFVLWGLVNLTFELWTLDLEMVLQSTFQLQARSDGHMDDTRYEQLEYNAW